MPEHTRIDELRGRVESDPASIAFAQLAEEYRRTGNLQEAVRICRAGLEKHPAYLSARVTLGRALLELQQYDEAQAEFEYVLLAAPDNLIALRSMSDIHQHLGAEGLPEVARGGHGDVGEPMPAAPVLTTLDDPVLAHLESFLTAILDDRASRAAS